MATAHTEDSWESLARGAGFRNKESKAWIGLAWKKDFRLCQNEREV
jgi:hypothetical protein